MKALQVFPIEREDDHAVARVEVIKFRKQAVANALGHFIEIQCFQHNFGHAPEGLDGLF